VVRDPYGRVRGKTEGAEGVGKPIGRPTNLVSTNLDLWELAETKSPTKKTIHRLICCSMHICSRELPFLASVGKDVPNPLEN